MTGVLKITLFGLFYRRMMQKADSIRVCVCVCVLGGGEGKRSCEVYRSVHYTSHFKRRDTEET